MSSKNIDATQLNQLMQTRNSCNRELLQCKTQLNHQGTLKRKSELTLEELNGIEDENVVVYRAVGRLFVRDNLADVKAEIKNIAEVAEVESNKMAKAVENLQKQLQNHDNDLKEFMK